MLSILRSNQPFAVILVGLTWILGVVWNGFFMSTTVTSWIFPEINHYFNGNPLRILVFQSIVQALSIIVLHRAYNSNEYISGGNYFATWIYALFAALFSCIFPAHPFLLLHLLLLLAMRQVFEVYRQNEVQHHYFNAALFLGCAMLFIPSSFVLAIALLVSLAYTRSGIWREWAWSIVGFVLPFLTALTLVWLSEDLQWIKHWQSSIVGVDLQEKMDWLAVPMGIWVVLGLRGLISSYGSSSNKARNTKSSSLIFLLACFVFVLINYDASWAALVFATLANISLLFPYPFEREKIKFVHHLLFAFLVGSSLFFFVRSALF